VLRWGCHAGDGLIYEVINGIMSRPDGAAVLERLPIGVVPSGSGNALAKQLTASANEPYDIVAAVSTTQLLPSHPMPCHLSSHRRPLCPRWQCQPTAPPHSSAPASRLPRASPRGRSPLALSCVRALR
jgi:hypothetical protein